MGGGYNNLALGHREQREKAKWWKVEPNQKNTSAEEIIRTAIPTAIIYVEQVSSTDTSRNYIGSNFQYGSSYTTIKTLAKIKCMNKNDLIKFRGQFWLVEDVRKVVVANTVEFSRQPSFETYITIRGIE